MNSASNRLLSVFLILTAISLGGCGSKTDSPDTALLWFQQSAESRAMFIQIYAWAEARLEQINMERGSQDAAILIDIDETVLDNSPQQAGILLGRHPDPEKSWDEWCHAAIATPLPGAHAFLTRADRLGFSIFYISNRSEKHLEATIQNLARLGFPQTDATHVLLRGKESSKEERRRLVAKTYRVELLLGDSLNDLSAEFETKNAEQRADRVDSQRDDFLKRFILFPNPMYGSWQRINPGKGGNPALRVWPDIRAQN